MRHKLTLHDALELMRSGSQLVLSHSRTGAEHWVVPGGAVSPAVAELIKQDPLVHAGRDGLLEMENHSQTWRLTG
jgi:hypothetical protein